MLDPTPERAYYFGDLDLAGLQIAVSAATQAKAARLPDLRPATASFSTGRNDGGAQTPLTAT